MRQIKAVTGKKQIVMQAAALAVAAVVLTFSVIMLFMGFDSRASENSVDGSSGGSVTVWHSYEDTIGAGDTRYDSGQYSAQTLGTEAAPYIIKNGDELAGLAALVKNGDDFAGKYIDIVGLSAAEATGDLQPFTIDLCKFNGSTGGGGARTYWEPIGVKGASAAEDKPFNGTVYSSVNASVINLILNSDAVSGSADPACFALFGYTGPSAVIGGEKGGFSLTFSLLQGTPAMTVPDSTTELRTVGGLVARNVGVIQGIKVYGNINLPENTEISGKTVLPFTVGAVAAYNTGSITDCYYRGVITSLGERIKTTEKDSSGIGGICGYSDGGDITFCIADASIIYNNTGMMGEHYKAGGIVGNFRGSANTIANCIFSGRISVADADNTSNRNGTLYGYLGGIAGLLQQGSIERCAASADIDCYYTNSATGTYIGGIAGYSRGSAITDCFAMGALKNGHATGGILGGGATGITRCYYTGTVQNCVALMDNRNGSSNTGGIVGEREASLTDSYFAGGTLSSNAGSLIGYTRTNKTISNVYYDFEVSPNSFSKSKKNGGDASESNYARTTAQLCAAFSGADWTNEQGHYPQLAWVDAADADTTYGKLVRALSSVSSECLLTLDVSDSYTDRGGRRTAYQMKEGNTGGGTFDNFTVNVQGVTASRGQWSEFAAFDGFFQNQKLGAVWERRDTLMADGATLGNILVRRKLLSAVNQAEGAATDITNASVYRLLDHANFASAAYIGGVFYGAEDIGQINIRRQFGTGESDNKRLANIFSSAIEGNGYKINNITFESGSICMLGAGEEGKVLDYSFGTVNMGTEASAITASADRLALFFATAQNCTMSGLTFDTVSVNVSSMPSGFYYGLMVSYDTKNTVLSDITINNYNMHIGSYNATGKSAGNTINGAGGLVGYLYSDSTAGRIGNCTISNMDCFVDIYENAYGLGSGGIAAYNYNCPMNNVFVTGKVYGVLGGSSSSNVRCMVLGGIAGVNKGGSYNNVGLTGDVTGGSYVGGIVGDAKESSYSIQNSFVIGNITAAPRNAAAIARSCVGGLVGYNDRPGTISTSFFTGNVTGGNAGGLIGSVNGGSVNITDSYAKAIVSGTMYTGGLVGSSVSTNNSVTLAGCYFSGQVKGTDKAGLISTVAKEKYSISNSYFDISIAGESVPTVASVSRDDALLGAQLDSACARASGQITAAGLSGAYSGINHQTNYPELTDMLAAHAQQSDVSTRKVFKVNDGAFLTSVPGFILLQDDTLYSVARNTALQDGLLPWDTVLTGPADGALYGPYMPKEKGDTAFTVQYLDYLQGTLDMQYDIVVRPFDYGSGTKSDPYIIYNINELKKFRTYLKNKNDTVNQYYKIGSVENGVVIGDAIVLDLSSDDTVAGEWEPIMYLSGHLDGNGSTIKNIVCKNGYTLRDEAGNIIDTYYGFFGTSTLSGNVKDLRIDKVTIEVSVSGKAGALIGQSAGGTYTNIVVTDAKIINKSGNNNELGGLIGSSVLSGENLLTITDCTVQADITRETGLNTYAGGLIGRATQSGSSNTYNLSAASCSAYGTIKNVKYNGGLIGSLSARCAVTGCISGVDIITETSNGYLGGLIGQLAAQNPVFTIDNSLYTGRMEAMLSTNYFGGFIGSMNCQVSLNTYDNAFADYSSVQFTGPNTPFADDNAVCQYIDALLKGRITGSFYNGDVNPFPAAGVSMTGTAYYLIESGTTSANIVYGGITACTGGKSSTYSLTRPGVMNGGFIYKSGHFPVTDAFDRAPQASQWDMDYLAALREFNSVAVFYTNAGGFADNTFVNLFFEAAGVQWQQVPAGMLKTYNGAMLLSTGEGAEVNAVLTQTIGGYTFTKTITMVPSIASCGVADFSFAYANRDGMWITADDEQYPFTLYTADQLQGLALIYSTSGAATDGSGLVLDFSAVGSAPSGTLGDQFVLGASIDAAVYDGNAFSDPFNLSDGGELDPNKLVPSVIESFLPIGTGADFDSSFNGRGYVIKNLLLDERCGSVLGLFGNVRAGSITGVGVVSGEINAGSGVQSAGGVAGSMSGDALIDGCFNACPITGDADGVSYGGIAGRLTGSGNTIMNSFFSGYIFAGGNSAAGGIAGAAETLEVRSSFVAGYIEASKADVICPGGNIILSAVSYDFSAVGSVKNEHSAPNSFPTATALGARWMAQSGLYPTPTAFSASGEAGVHRAAYVPVYLTNARSVTKGSVGYEGAQLFYCKKDGFTGTVIAGGSEVVSGDTAFSDFVKSQSGAAVLKVQWGDSARYIVVNLQCWYDAGRLNGNNFVINTPQELAEFSALVNGTLNINNNPNGLHTHDGQPISFEGYTVTLGADIDMSGLEGGFTPIGTAENPFKGIFDGGERVISNINVNAAGYAGLFGVTENAVIKNVGLNGGSIAGATAGGIAGYAKGGTITGCFSSAGVSGKSVGGIAGQSSAHISDCFNFGNIGGSAFAGGICGSSTGGISSCFNTGIINSPDAVVGGISAENSGTVSNCLGGAFLHGTAVYAIAPGNVTACVYDGQLMGTVDANGAQRLTSGSAYPDAVASGNPFNEVRELAYLRLSVNGEAYNKFNRLELLSEISSGSVRVSDAPQGVLAFEPLGGSYGITAIDSGACYITASSVIDGKEYAHNYYVVAVMTMRIRYEFNFSLLLDANANINSGRAQGYGTANTFNSGDAVCRITSAQDYLDFAAYVNGGGSTAGKTFVLEANVNLDGRAVVPVGSADNPFLGEFDGRGYSIDNMSVSAKGTAAMFGAVGKSASVYNFLLGNCYFNARTGGRDIYLAAIAAVNYGNISNIGVRGGLYTANAGYAFNSYIGSLCADNRGRIRGCYFINSGASQYGIDHVSRPEDPVGGLVGINTGSITGCYISSDLRVATVTNIKTLVGDNGGREDNIVNCYYNMDGDIVPVYLPYAYDDIAFNETFVTATDMKTPEFAAWLSSNIYAGTFKQGSEQAVIANGSSETINGGFPYLQTMVLSKYSVYDKIGDNAVLLSVRNLARNSADSTVLSGLITYQAEDYRYFDNKYFTSIVTNDLLRFDVDLLPGGIDAVISGRVYGKNASFNTDVLTGSVKPESVNVALIPNTEAGRFDVTGQQYSGVEKPNLIVITIKLTGNPDYKPPWGVDR